MTDKDALELINMKKVLTILSLIFCLTQSSFAKDNIATSDIMVNRNDNLKYIATTSAQNTTRNDVMKEEQYYSIKKSVVYDDGNSNYRWLKILSKGSDYFLAERISSNSMDMEKLFDGQYQDIQTLNEYDVHGSVGCSYFKVKKNGKWAVYSVKKNAFISNFVYDEIEDLWEEHFNERLMVKVSKGNKWAILSDNIQSVFYDDILPIEDYFGQDLVKVSKNNKWGVYVCSIRIYNGCKYKNQELSDIIYDNIRYQSSSHTGVNDYIIDSVEGLKNGQWVTIIQNKYTNRTLGDKFMYNFFKNFGM